MGNEGNGAKGRRTPPEWSTFIDPQTGISVQQLTHYKGHSHHLYFTNSGWYTDGEGEKLLFGSDRCNATNLYSLNLTTGEITQLTDLSAETDFLFSSLNPQRPEVYFWYQRTLIALDLITYHERLLYRVPDGYAVNMTSVTADGKSVCTGLYEDLSSRFKIDLLHGYVGFEQYWEAMPHSQILRISTDSGQCDVVYQEKYWIGHVNASQTQPELVTFCHEGPWQNVDQRIWGLNLQDGQVWKIRPTAPGEQVGHEYWFTDGLHIGYHGRYANGESFYGSIRYDNSERVESAFVGDSMHFHSNDLRLIVGDSTREKPSLLIWKHNGQGFEGPRKVFEHRGTFQIQQLHVHPRFSPDGKHILFTSDPGGYGNLYRIETPDFDSLPVA